MQLKDFDYNLPSELIAQYPLDSRRSSRLLCLDGQTGDIEHRQFEELPKLLHPDDFLVFNNTRVIPARIFGAKPTGGKVEILIERILSENRALAMVKSSKSLKLGQEILLDDNCIVEVLERKDDMFLLLFHWDKSVLDYLESYGNVPLPPYVNRTAQTLDDERYQTVYGVHKGAVAAPTAGLHFDEEMIEQLKGIVSGIGFVTLHVGAGTFQPVRVENIKEHNMHKEYMIISQELCDKVNEAKSRGGRIIAIGTTSIRALESSNKDGVLMQFQGDTGIFIYPGFEFKCVDAMVTNFHLPQSTLLMLLCAFAGVENVREAYEEAVAEKYRFFSYGDAMFVTKRPVVPAKAGI